LIKHLGTRGIEELNNFLNVTAIDNKPPQSRREAKLVPIYKNKGRTSDPNNYHSIAINTPFAKIFMATINRRLTHIVMDKDLHALTQAGFREFHSTVEEAFIVQTLVQYCIQTKRKLGMLFIDLKRAYDSINRRKLW
jgi:Reverse transcriptase (RNA-dependent DNA polymerase)